MAMDINSFKHIELSILEWKGTSIETSALPSFGKIKYTFFYLNI